MLVQLYYFLIPGYLDLWKLCAALNLRDVYHLQTRVSLFVVRAPVTQKEMTSM